MDPTFSMTDDTAPHGSTTFFLFRSALVPLSCLFAPATEHLRSQTTPTRVRHNANRELPPRTSGGTVNDPKGIGASGGEGPSLVHLSTTEGRGEIGNPKGKALSILGRKRVTTNIGMTFGR